MYTIGHDQISQSVQTWNSSSGLWSPASSLFFGYDGHGSVRVLYDAMAAIVTSATNNILQLFHFDAHGNLLNMQAVEALTSYLYSGEAFDSSIGQQYLRARWYDATTGRFNRLDPFFGNLSDPQSLHKYLYVHGDPVNGVDPTGKILAARLVGLGIGSVFGGVLGGAISSYSGGNIFRGAIFGALGFGALGFGAGAFLSAFGLVGFSMASLALLMSPMFFLAQQSSQQLHLSKRRPSAAEADNAFNYATLSFDVYPKPIGGANEVFGTLGWIGKEEYLDFETGFAARVYRNPSRGEMVVSFRGTDTGSVAEWLTDMGNNFRQGLGIFGEGSQYGKAKSVAEGAVDLAKQEGFRLHFTGHSLGGGLATAAALHVGVPATTFNSSGVNSLTTDTSSAPRLITTYRVIGDILSTLQDSIGWGWLMPNSSQGTTYYLPGESPNALTRHTDDILPSLQKWRSGN